MLALYDGMGKIEGIDIQTVAISQNGTAAPYEVEVIIPAIYSGYEAKLFVWTDSNSPMTLVKSFSAA